MINCKKQIINLVHTTVSTQAMRKLGGSRSDRIWFELTSKVNDQLYDQNWSPIWDQIYEYKPKNVV